METNVVHSLKDRKNLQKNIERKVDSAVRGEIMAQRKLYSLLCSSIFSAPCRI